MEINLLFAIFLYNENENATSEDCSCIKVHPYNHVDAKSYN